MSNGFVQRFKGKVNLAPGGLWVAGTQCNATGADLNVNSGWGTVNTSTSSTAAPVQLTTARVGGIDILAPVALTGGSIYRLPPPIPGATKLISYSTINGSTIIFVTASTAGAVVFSGVGSTGSTASFAGTGGTTLSNTFKSTQGCQVELMGISTAAWLVTGVLPTTVGHLTWSTST